jgi:hypothetical protein
VENRVKQIIYHEREARRLQAETDEHQWIAARLISEELETGKAKAQLGREIHKTEAHVRYMARCHKAKLKFGSDLPPFNTVYNSPEVRGKRSLSLRGKSSLSPRVQLIILAEAEADRCQKEADDYRRKAEFLEASMKADDDTDSERQN